METENITYCDDYKNIVILSKTCIDSFVSTQHECIRNNDDTKSIIRMLVGIWSSLIAICGTLGNVLTLVAITHAAKHNRYGLNQNYRTTTIFVLHLSFVDLCCCFILGPIYASMYFPKKWPWGANTCRMAYPIIVALSFIDWLALSFVALSRCINIIKPLFWRKFCDKKFNLVTMIAGIWIFGGLWVVPDVIEPSVIFGWNCENGQCSTIKSSDAPIICRLIGLGFVIPAVVVIISYTIIICYVKKSSKYLRKDRDSIPFEEQNVQNANRLDGRDMKMTWSILFVSLCYIFCAAPVTTLVVLHQKASYYWILATGLYLSLFMLNFFVYSLQNQQYQKAYLDYLKMLKYLLSNGSLDGFRTIHHKESMKISSSTKRLNKKSSNNSSSF